MIGLRQQYRKFDWNEAIQKRILHERIRVWIDWLIVGFFGFALGAFAAVIVISYYPLPWQ